MRFTLLLITLLAHGACSSAEAGDEGAPAERERAATDESSLRAVRVEVAVVRTVRAGLESRWPGEVIGSRDALLASSTGGFIERVSVEEGDEVREGQVLVRVDTASAGARTAQARVEVEAAERELERAERLSGAISEQQLDAARTRLAGARAGLRAAQVMSSRSVIRAPFAGTIAEVEAERGEVAAPGAPLVRLVQLSPIHVTIAVPDRDVSLLHTGMPARVSLDALAAPFEGEIVRVSPAANLRTRAFEVRVAVPNEGHQLLPGMIGDVEITGAADDDSIVIPQHTLVTKLEANGVFIDDNGVARWQEVQTGRVIRDQVVVEGGLEPGQRLIVTGHRELAEGDPILVTREGTCCRSGRVVFGEEVASSEPSDEPGDEAEEATP